ncbi:hypothetical protein QBC35DRAFT_173994 [Podospora australis]|uniref:Zn(2)-C6 fungal-type domain-containing protein n=1 Tax=Podospora australis TaxID=1536484 RepID=A0AAN7AHM0_9PEZI|nr:hypothetical protein QBC35DRAFT_173994 [Podospora australis]
MPSAFDAAVAEASSPFAGQVRHLNYIPRIARDLPLVPNGEEMMAMVKMLEEVEGVFHSGESLAAHMGVTVDATRRAQGPEISLEGPIVTVPKTETIDWRSIVEWARSGKATEEKIKMVNGSGLNEGKRFCCFHMNDIAVFVSECDWRLVETRCADAVRALPDTPREADETTELAIMEITDLQLISLLHRTRVLMEKAKAVKARVTDRIVDLERRRSVSVTPSPDLDIGMIRQELHDQLLGAKNQPSASPEPLRAGEVLDQQLDALAQTWVGTLETGDRIVPPCDPCRAAQARCRKSTSRTGKCERCISSPVYHRCSFDRATDQEIAVVRAAAARSLGISTHDGVGPRSHARRSSMEDGPASPTPSPDSEAWL